MNIPHNALEIDLAVRAGLGVRPDQTIDERARNILRRRSSTFRDAFVDKRAQAARILLTDGPPWERMAQAADVLERGVN